MKKILIFILILSGIEGLAQTPPGYTSISARYDWLAGRFRNGLHVPQYNGVPTDRTGVWIGDGAVAIDTANGYFYWRVGGVWIKSAKFTDAGRFGIEDATGAQNRQFNVGNFSFWIYSTDGNTYTRRYQTPIDYILSSGVNGTGDSVYIALRGEEHEIEILSRDESGLGIYSLLTVAHDQAVITSGDLAGPGTNSMVVVAKNQIELNPSLGVLKIDTLTYVPGIKALRYNPTTGLVSYADTTTGGGGGGDVFKVGTPVDNQIGIWTGDGTIEGDVDATFDGTRLTSSFRAPNGSATTPSYSFTNSTGTGLYFDGTYYAEAMGTVPIRNVFVISGASGLSQIDYPSPSAAALGDGKSFSTIALGDSWATSGAFEASSAVLGANSGLSNGFNIVAGNAAGKIDFFAGGFAAGNHVMTIDPNLRVGIGVTSPLATLHLVGGFRYVDGAQGAGKVLVSDADGDATWTTGIPISSLTAATASNDINNLGHRQIWRWNSLDGVAGLDIQSNSALVATSTALVNINYSGANANSGLSNPALVVVNARTGTTSTNVGASFAASGATNNYAIIVPASFGNVGIGTSTPTATLDLVGRFVHRQGADVASVNGAITLGSDGNMFELTGTNSVTLISNVGWLNGSEIVLLFTSTATLVDGTANSGTDIGMELAGNVNFVGSAGSVLTFVLSEIGGTQRFREKNRSVN